MDKPPVDQERYNELWREFFMGGSVGFHRTRQAFRLLPSSPRCKVCLAPFKGVGGQVMRVIGRGPAKMNPNICDTCEQVARKAPGGAVVPMSLLFADIRGSTQLAETLGTTAFSALIARFYDALTAELIKGDALIDRLIGDEVLAIFVPVLTGDRHAQAALKAAQAILRATGHEDPGGPWVPVGASIHTGDIFIGSVGSAGVSDITVLGDDVNLAARLASVAATGEIVISETARAAAGYSSDGLEPRRVEVKGRSTPVDTWILRIGTHTPAVNGSGGAAGT